MKKPWKIGLAAMGLIAGATTLPAMASASTSSANARAVDIGRQVLPANDGWASADGGTTGGAAADSQHVYVVSNRSELVAALDNGSSTPKVIYVKGTIDANVDANNVPLQDPESYYAQGTGYDFQQYLADYNPDVWGRTEVPSGPQEDARAAAEKNQANNVIFNIGSNTTIVGVGKDAKIVGGDLALNKGTDNVIVRNIEFQNAYDYFPQWDPTDGSTGNWNSEFDAITIKYATHVWIDHDTFDDGNSPDSQTPNYYGRQYQCHDGLVDISDAADFITVSYDYFHDHDKTTLVGSSDSGDKKYGDDQHLRVTFDHNLYQNIVQRTPRVRFGEVSIYDNYYIGNPTSGYPFLYAWGVGKGSRIYAQNNYFQEPAGFDAASIIGVYSGTSIYATGTLVDVAGKKSFVDVVAAYNKENPNAPLDTNVGWTPTLFNNLIPAQAVPAVVSAKAGAGKLVSMAPMAAKMR